MIVLLWRSTALSVKHHETQHEVNGMGFTSLLGLKPLDVNFVLFWFAKNRNALLA